MPVTAASRDKLNDLLRSLPSRLVAGHVGAEGRIAEAMLRAGGLMALSIIKEAFIVKSRGGTDEAGIQWAPLSPKTIAYNRRHPGLAARKARAGQAGRASRPLLTAKLDALWRRIYAQTRARLGNTPGAEGIAAGHAWNVVKAAGGKTILSEYGSRPVEIGRDTGRLLASLSPGSPDSLLDVAARKVAVGTNVEYAAGFHSKRPMWPDSFPDVWAEKVAEAMAQAGVKALAEELSRGS